MGADDETRWGGLAAMAGGALDILLTPVFASAYLHSEEVSPTFLVDAFRSAVDPLLGFASVETVYRTYGRVYLLPAVLMFLGFLALRSVLAGRVGGVAARGLGVALAGWVMVLVGLVGDYWVGDAFGDILHNLSFLVETLGILVVLIGSLLVGLAARRTGLLPRSAAWSLILALPLAIVGLVLTGHLPSGPMLGVSVASIIVGSVQWSGVAERAVGGSHAGRGVDGDLL